MKFIAALATLLLVAGSPAMAAPAKLTTKAPPKAAPARIVLPTDVRPDRYDIHIVPDAAKLSFTGHETIDLTVVRPTTKIVLNAADIAFQKVSLPGQDAPKVVLESTHEETLAIVPLGVLKDYAVEA